MTWVAQVGHVMAKDVRQARSALIGYLGIVAVAWLHAIEWLAPASSLFGVSMFLVVIVGMLVAALVVQADSPTRSDAFWASRPFHPTAVLAAKALLVLLIVVGLPVIAQLHALIATDLSVSMTAAMLVKCAWIFSLWLLMAMVLAGVTQDLRSFTVALIMLPATIALFTIASNLSMVRRGASSVGLTILTLIGALGVLTAIGLLVRLYRDRTLGRSTWAVVVISVVCTFAAITGPVAARPSAGERIAPPTEDFGAALEIVDDGVAPVYLRVGIDTPTHSDRLVTLDSGDIVMRLVDGKTIRAPFRGRYVLVDARLPVKDGVRWLDNWGFGATRGNRTGLQLDRTQREAVVTGVSAAWIEGIATTSMPRLVLSVPLRVGASERRNGNSVRVLAVNSPDDDSLAVISQTSVLSSSSLASELFMSWWVMPHFALVNDARGEAVSLQGRSPGSSEALVLPSVVRYQGQTSLMLTSRRRIPEMATGWLDRATLVVCDWVRVGYAPVRLPLSVSKAPNESRLQGARPAPQGPATGAVRAVPLR